MADNETTVEDIWVAAVRETGIWLSPYAEQVAEFGRLVIPKMREAFQKERQRCAGIAREIKRGAERDRDDENNHHKSDRDAAACWADCAAQILHEIESSALAADASSFPALRLAAPEKNGQ